MGACCGFDVLDPFFFRRLRFAIVSSTCLFGLFTMAVALSGIIADAGSSWCEVETTNMITTAMIAIKTIKPRRSPAVNVNIFLRLLIKTLRILKSPQLGSVQPT